MRFAPLLLAILTATSASAQVESARNPFSPSRKASGPAQEVRAAPSTVQSAPSQLPPRIPPPPPGLRLPPVVQMRELPPPSVPSPAASSASAVAPDAAASDAQKSGPDVFLSREAITKGRESCHLELKGTSSLRATADGGVIRVPFSNPSNKSCFMGMQSDKVWASIRGAGVTAAEVEVQPNPTRSPRSTKLIIATANDRWSLSLTQAAGSRDVEELELDDK